MTATLASSSSLLSRRLLLSSSSSSSFRSLVHLAESTVPSSSSVEAGSSGGPRNVGNRSKPSSKTSSKPSSKPSLQRFYSSRRSLSSPSSALRLSEEKSKHIEMNRRIAELGGDWRGLLELQKSEGGAFNGVNWATATSRLGRLGAREMAGVKRDKRVSGGPWICFCFCWSDGAKRHLGSLVC